MSGAQLIFCKSFQLRLLVSSIKTIINLPFTPVKGQIKFMHIYRYNCKYKFGVVTKKLNTDWKRKSD